LSETVTPLAVIEPATASLPAQRTSLAEPENVRGAVPVMVLLDSGPEPFCVNFHVPEPATERFFRTTRRKRNVPLYCVEAAPSEVEPAIVPLPVHVPGRGPGLAVDSAAGAAPAAAAKEQSREAGREVEDAVLLLHGSPFRWSAS